MAGQAAAKPAVRRRLTPVTWAQAAQGRGSDLSSAARLLAGVIALHADPVSMRSRAGAAQLVAWSGKSRRWVIYARRELVDRGWVLLSRSRTPYGDEDSAVLLLRIPVDNEPDVVQNVHQGGADTALPPPPPGGADTAPLEGKDWSKAAAAPSVDNGGCALGAAHCVFCRRGLEHPP